ncbi:MAG: beta-lactamase family protein, partial [Gemmatimonadota bacterium]
VQEGALARFRTAGGRTAVIAYAEETNLRVGNQLMRELRLLGDTVNPFRLYPASGPASYDSARAVIADNPRVVFATGVRFIAGRGHVQMPDSLAALIQQTDSLKPTVVASLGSPYLLRQLPTFGGTFLIAWSDAVATERAVARALRGGAPISGRLPITLSDTYPRGHGVTVAASLTPARLDGVARLLEHEVAEGAFPGAVLAVGHRGAVAVRAVGRYGEEDPRPVHEGTVYDLASLTKVVGLTTATMLLVAEGTLELDRPAQHYLPAFEGPGKEGITVRHLLTHSSGLPAWDTLYLKADTPEEALALVMRAPLEAAPGERYVYSDLGAITLTKVVEAVAGEPLDALLERRVFKPLAMRHTRFRPPEEWLPMIAPTERDPWRGRLVHGEVHDENAYRLGGVSGHAGLFSTAPDLARFAGWMLDAWAGRLTPGAEPSLPAEVVREFTRRQPGPEGSSRALGWDTPSPSVRSSAGTLLSPSSFGHTGFTGTSIWIDPERELFIILLTNRVHPTRDNRAILRIRGQVADSVVAALDGAPAAPQP